MLQHCLGMKIRNQKGDIVALQKSAPKVNRKKSGGGTGTGFRLRMMKFSARPVKNLVNLCAKILSMLSACLILMLMRIELIEGSINTCSFSLRAM
jgi:hypothetical protein